MSIGNKGENLIFLISQMRGGSTLVQSILGSHPEIHTVPEPWVALPSLYTLYTRKIRKESNTEYNLYWARTAIADFVQKLPRREEDYLEGIRRMHAYIYECAMAGSGRRYFLDKGPRYFLIIPELYKVFPDAKFIFLLRNPLAVLTSINNAWMKGDFRQIYQFKHDLLEAPRRLLEGMQLLGERSIVVRYEQLLENPEAEIRSVCEKLGIGFMPEILNYCHKEEHKGSLGFKEQKAEYRSGRPDAANIDRWALSLKDPRVWRLASDYLHYLGNDTIGRMGYSYEELRKSVDRYYPGPLRAMATAPLLRLLKRTEIAAMKRPVMEKPKAGG